MAHDPTRGYLELADWRRRVGEVWATWRREAATDPATATAVFRAARDALFRRHPQSPLPPAARASFPGLAYWPYDPAWRMTVRLIAETPLPPPEAPTAAADPSPALPASGPGPFAGRRLGHVELTGPAAGRRLAVFWLEGYAGGLFLPFRDATSGGATYGGGRYLLDGAKGADHGGDVRRGELVLDFNLAYHPSCAYDPRWPCPLAPPENRLTLAVAAGERLAGGRGPGRRVVTRVPSPRGRSSPAEGRRDPPGPVTSRRLRALPQTGGATCHPPLRRSRPPSAASSRRPAVSRSSPP